MPPPGTQIDPASKAKLAEIRAKTPWTNRFTDEVLLIMIKKYGTQYFDVEDVQYFKWGADPITGKVLPAVGKFATGPIVSGLLIAIVALFLIAKMK